MLVNSVLLILDKTNSPYARPFSFL
ncbi:hypothetical protein ZWY2020_018663 [Hordeum vulgare]|nr:hypothetical protein ZWY2020_018663 [Hordeum vulgare]